MISLVATVLCFGCIGYLFWMDRRRSDVVSNAVWIPFFWMLFAGSRFASQWWDLGPPVSMGVEAYSEGSPLDRNVFLALILAGTWVLARRNINWAFLLKNNAWVFLFFLFAAMSILWSDYPVISFKRWVKGAGNLVMALVLLTEKRPYEALGAVLRRLAFVLLPLSILFIRYYPELGRSYHGGAPMFTGVAFQKNTLGQLCMLIGIYFAWLLLLRHDTEGGTTSRPHSDAPRFTGLAFHKNTLGHWCMLIGSYFGWLLLHRRDSDRNAPYRPHSTVLWLIVLMLLWLLYMAHSATAQAIMLISIGLFLVARLPYFSSSPRRLVVFVLSAGGLYLALDQAYGIQDAFIRMLGREPDLTDRRPLWDMLLGMVPNRWLGTGYEIFWSEDRLRHIWMHLGYLSGGLVQAHNGFIDLYLNLGLTGIALLGIGILSGVLKARTLLYTEYAHALLRLSFIVAALAYNYTEAAFKPLNNVFILLLFSILVSAPLPEAQPGLAHSTRPKPPVRAYSHGKRASQRPTNSRYRFHQGNAGSIDGRVPRSQLSRFRYRSP